MEISAEKLLSGIEIGDLVLNLVDGKMWKVTEFRLGKIIAVNKDHTDTILFDMNGYCSKHSILGHRLPYPTIVWGVPEVKYKKKPFDLRQELEKCEFLQEYTRTRQCYFISIDCFNSWCVVPYEGGCPPIQALLFTDRAQAHRVMWLMRENDVYGQEAMVAMNDVYLKKVVYNG